MLKVSRHCSWLVFPFLAVTAAGVSAEPRLTDFKDRLVANVPVGAAPSFVAVQLLRQPDAKASEVVSLDYIPQLGPTICLQIVSQDGRYSASGVIDLSGQTEGAQSIRIPLAGEKKSFVTGLPERELAVELSYRSKCNEDSKIDVRAVAWFGKERPGGVFNLLFQALNNEAYLLTDQPQPNLRQKCQKIIAVSGSSTAAINAICQLKPATTDFIQQVEIQIMDPFNDLDKSIKLKVPSK
jgi:hypothetical protein